MVTGTVIRPKARLVSSRDLTVTVTTVNVKRDMFTAMVTEKEVTVSLKNCVLVF